VTVFADPMCDVLDSLTNPKNKSHIPISGNLCLHLIYIELREIYFIASQISQKHKSDKEKE